jgi:putative peptide zinc metalloprotease protein
MTAISLRRQAFVAFVAMQDIRPRFRPDIITHAYDGNQGGGSIVLEDPVANKFFRISPYELELLEVLDGTRTLSEALERLRLHGRHFTTEHATSLVEQFSRAGLLLGTSFGTSAAQATWKKTIDREAKKRSLTKMYYAYVPILNPDRFLSRTLILWRLLVNRMTALLVLPLGPGAAYLLVTGLDRLETAYLFFFNFQNLLVLWIAIAVVKLVHEFSHAYTAKSFGLRVPEMGLAFLIFFPCLYCNTTAAWELADRKQRIAIAAAGIVAEVVVAVFATYVWYFSSPGLTNSIAFYLIAISLVSSFLFNGNPLLKFDGYFVLTDVLGIPNLQTKAFGYVRHLFLNRVLGIESVRAGQASSRERTIFVIYGVSAYLYRVALYFGIVCGVYSRFDKTIGFILGSVWLSLFIGRPLIRSVKTLSARRGEIHPRTRGVAVMGLLMGTCVLAAVIPWSSNSVYPCYLESAELRQIAIPAGAPVKDVFVRQGDLVKADQVLITLDPTPLHYALKAKETDLLQIKKEMEIVETTEKDLPKLELKRIELSQAQDAVEKVKWDISHTEWSSPFDGVVTKLSPALQPGAQPGRGAVVGEVAKTRMCQAVGLVPENDVAMVQPGTEVKVYFPFRGGQAFRLNVREVSLFKVEDLEASPFSSRFGGEIATEAKQEDVKDSPLEPHYVCRAGFLNGIGIPLGMTGRMIVQRPPRSILRRSIDRVYRTFYREIAS